MDLRYAALVQCWLRSQKDEYVIKNNHDIVLSLSLGLHRKRILEFKYGCHCVHKGIPCVEWAGMAQSV